MRNKLYSLIIAAIAGLGCVNAQTVEPSLVELDSLAKAKFISNITSEYNDWNSISLSGKLSAAALPLKPSVKVYMEKDVLTIISLSAPIIGEAGRMEIDNDKILVVNKYSNTYSTVSMEECESVCPGGLTALQNLLLGRISLMGKGTLTANDAADVEVYDAMIYDVVLPNNTFQPKDYTYFYTLDPATLLLSNFLIVSEQDESNVAQCAYSYADNSTTLDFNISIGGKMLQASLQFNKPDANPKKIDRIELSSKYRQVSPEKIIQ